MLDFICTIICGIILTAISFIWDLCVDLYNDRKEVKKHE